MEEKYEEVKMTIYEGMAIFNLIKDYDLSIDKENISLEDKKYLSLYLGIMSTKNKITEYLEKNKINFKTYFNFNKKILKIEDYIELYNNYFVEIFNEINFDSIYKYIKYLLGKKIVQDFNEANGYYIDKIFEQRNKQLIKTIN